MLPTCIRPTSLTRSSESGERQGKRLQNAHAPGLTKPAVDCIRMRVFCKRFSGTSGQNLLRVGAPMLVGTPLSGRLPVHNAPSVGLWIRRVLVRAQEGQLEARYHDEWCRASTVLDPLSGLVRRVLFARQIEL